MAVSKNIIVLSLVLLFISSTLFAQDTNNFSVNVQLLKPIIGEEIKLKVLVKNVAGKTIKVLKDRIWDFKREKIKSLGNYVIEIERSEHNIYHLFTPSADIDPVFENEEYIFLKQAGSITDTLTISGLSFSRINESKKGFPPGKYRLRIYFNPDMWNDSRANSSMWLDFNIE